MLAGRTCVREHTCTIICNDHACYLTRKDKYNKKINKYYVEYEEEDEQVLSDEEKERHEDGEEASQLKRLDHFHCALCTRYMNQCMSASLERIETL